MNLETTNIDLGNVILCDAEFDDFTIPDPGAQKTWAEGTIFVIDGSKNATVYDPGAYAGQALAVMTAEQSTEGGEDVPSRLAISGKLRQQRLVIDDGTPVNEVDYQRLRNYSLVSVSVTDQSVLDNQ